MATGKIKMQVLDVGQGSGNLVEIYDTAGTLINTALLDLGSRSVGGYGGDKAVTYVVDTLKGMGPGRKIDVVVLSHSDDDHINLIGDVLKNFQPPGSGMDELQINHVYYGGDPDKYVKGDVDVLALLEKFMVSSGDVPLPFGPGEDTWSNHYGRWVPFHTTDGVTFDLLIGNAPAPGERSTPDVESTRRVYGFAINTWSAVVIVGFAGRNFVITGDATGTTMAHANDVMGYSGKLSQVMMLTAPHHGSRSTSLDIRGIDNDTTASANLEDFAANVGAEVVTASAERHGTYKHPSALVLSYFWKADAQHWFWQDARLDDERHFYTAWFTTGDGWELQSKSSGPKKQKIKKKWPEYWNYWYTVQTEGNVYSNLYFVDLLQSEACIPGETVQDKLPSKAPVPALGVQWSFTVQADGTQTMSRIEDRTALLARSFSSKRLALPAARSAPPHHEIAERALLAHGAAPPPRGLMRAATLMPVASHAATGPLRGLRSIR